MVKLNFDEILYVESFSDYLKIHLADKSIITRETITSIGAKLPQKDFMRIHRSYIVAFDHIDSFTNEHIEIGRTQLPISRSYKNDVLVKLDKLS
jgi:DNA-binding LytR/AlgR family response regulator